MGRFRSFLILSSLACCVLLLALWVRSYWRWSSIEYAGGGVERVIDLDHGTLMVAWSWGGFPQRSGLKVESGPSEPLDWAKETTGYSFLGFGGHVYTDQSGGARQFWFPIWFPTVLTALAPALWAWRRHRTRGGAGFPVEVGAGVGAGSGDSF